MYLPQWLSAPVSKGIAVALVVAFSGASIAFVRGDSGSGVPAQAPDKLEATIFSYDGHDFVRVRTTLVTQEGKSAVNTKLDQNTPAYRALIQKHSYTGNVTVFGRAYDANYAPLTDAAGGLTGALFVAIAR